MDNKKYLYITAIFAVSVFLLYGCLSHGNYGRLVLQSINGDMVTIQTLENNWQDYTIYYAGPGIKNPSAVMFDPKSDNRTIVNKGWIKIENQETVSELIIWIRANAKFEPKLWKILGPDNHLYGYMYTSWEHAHIKVIDDKTLWVDDLPVPPIDYGPSRMNMRK